MVSPKTSRGKRVEPIDTLGVGRAALGNVCLLVCQRDGRSHDDRRIRIRNDTRDLGRLTERRNCYEQQQKGKSHSRRPLGKGAPGTHAKETSEGNKRRKSDRSFSLKKVVVNDDSLGYKSVTLISNRIGLMDLNQSMTRPQHRAETHPRANSTCSCTSRTLSYRIV